MGTDIHLAAEERRTDGRWAPITHFPIQRSYLLFGALCGVRNQDLLQLQPEPRGLPEDLSRELDPCDEQSPLYGADHSFSYATLRELLDFPDDQLVCTWKESNADRGVDREYRRLSVHCPDFTAVIKYLQAYARVWHKASSDVRIVFGFDS